MAGELGAAAPAAGAAAMSYGPLLGATAMTAVLNNMYQQELDKRKREQEAQAMQSQVIGQQGTNQQNVLAQMMSGYKSAYGK